MHTTPKRSPLPSKWSRALFVLLTGGLMIALTRCDAPTDALDSWESYPWDSSSYVVEDGNWYKGNLHAHSYWSGDAFDYPEMVLKWYRDNGYDFASLSEHDVMARGERWIEFPKSSDSLQVFQDYLAAFGEEWVTYEESENSMRVRLKSYDEYKPRLDQSGFLVVQSEEISDGNFRYPVHVGGVNLSEEIAPQDGFTDVDMLQNNLNAVRDQDESSGRTMLPVVNHPLNEFTFSPGDLNKLEGFRFMEIFNAAVSNWEYAQQSEHGPIEKPGNMWDSILSYNRVHGKPPVYGLGTDDAHDYAQFGRDYNNPGRAWITVWSEELTAESLMKSINYGKFYASNGVRLSEVNVDADGISLRIAGESGVSYTTQFIGTRSGESAENGEVLAEVSGTSPSYSFDGDERYVRARVISSRPMEPYGGEGQMEEAWTQPVIPGRETHRMGGN